MINDQIMNLSPLTNEQRLAVATFRKFAQSEIRPVARAYRNRLMPRERMLELHQAIAEFGLPGGAIAREHGGLGISRATEAMLFEELAKSSAAVSASVLINMLIARLLLLAKPSLRDRYLHEVITGRKIGGLAIGTIGSEMPVSDEGFQGRWRGTCLTIDGGEARVPNGVHADFIICTVRSASGASSHVILDREEHQYEILPADQLASGYKHVAHVSVRGTQVNLGSLIGREGGAPGNMATIRDQARVHIAMMGVGLMQAALDSAITYARERELFEGNLSVHHPMAARMVEMAGTIDAARLMCQRCMGLMDAGRPSESETRMAKWFVAEMGVRICGQAVQIEGIDSELDIRHFAPGLTGFPLRDCPTEQEKLPIARELTRCQG